MTNRQITNCHVHLFTLDHVPTDYPCPWVGFVRNRPILIKLMALAFRGAPEVSEQILRLGRMAAAGRRGDQEGVLRELQRQYPEGTPICGAAHGYRRAVGLPRAGKGPQAAA